MNTILSDLAYAGRSARKSPGFTIVAGLTLSIAIGGATAVFSVVKSVLLDRLPYRSSSRLVAIHEDVPKFDQHGTPMSTIEFNLLRGRVKSFEDMGAYECTLGELSGVAVPRSISIAKMTAGLFEVLGVQPQLGRVFHAEEDIENPNVALISHALWIGVFGGDPSIIGRSINVDRIPRQVIGVMPESFVFPMRGPSDNAEPGDVFLPMGFTTLERQGRGPILQKSVIGRLKDGVPVQQAQAELQSLVPSVIAAMPSTYSTIAIGGLSFPVVALRTEITRGVSRILWLLLSAAGVLLLIACANVANLVLTRAVARKREYAIRAALGANRAALSSMVLCESLVLAITSALAGVGIAGLAHKILSTVSAIQIPRAESVRNDIGVFAFAFLVGLATAFLCGGAAALQASRVSANEALKDATRGSTGGGARYRTLHVLVSAQFALTVVLLIAGGLMLRSLAQTLAVSPGFRPENAVSVTTHLPYSSYSDAEKVHTALSQLVASAESAPGIEAAGIGTELPLGVWEKGGIRAEPSPVPDPNFSVIASQVWVTGHFLEALGVPLKRGRFFSDAEYVHNRQVVIINDALAEKLWPGQEPVGKRLHNSRLDISTVVGVVGDVKEGSLNNPAVPQIYEPNIQLPDRLLGMSTIPFFRTVNLISRAKLPASSQMTQEVAAIHRVDASLAVYSMRGLGEVIAESVGPQRFNTILVAAFAVMALLLAVMGTVSVLAYSVAQRRNEIGIRMALGAQRADVSRMIVGRGSRLALIGIAVGIVCGLATARVLGAYIHGVSVFDPVTFILVPVLLTVIALGASYWPARRAASIDPIIVMRAE